MESNGSPLSLDTLYFEAMADQLEDALSKLTIIEARVANLESVMETKSGDSISVNAMSDASNTAVEQALNAYKSQVLEKLKTIKETFLAEGKDIASIRKERDELLQENLALKKERERLNYRVKHLIKALNEEEAKNKNT